MQVLRKEDLEDAAEALASHGFKKLITFKMLPLEAVDRLGLPVGTTMELKSLLQRLRDTTPPASAAPV